MRNTSSGRLLNSFIFPEFSSDATLDEASKWLMIRVFLAKAGLFLFVNMFLVFLCRAATKKIAPALDEDPVIIKIFNRILQNSLEQMAIFGCLYFYFLFDKAGIDKLIKAIALPSTNCLSLPLGFSTVESFL